MDRVKFQAALLVLVALGTRAAVGADPADPSVPAPQKTAVSATATPVRGPVCVWRLAFRAPNRIYFGCRWSDTLATSTNWVDLTAAELQALGDLQSKLTEGAGEPPLELGALDELQEPTLCDRFWLWAVDEGARAPAMTRARKIRQACGPRDAGRDTAAIAE